MPAGVTEKRSANLQLGVLQRVRDTIRRHRMFSQGSAVGVAVSGGADSMCLLHALAELRPALGIRLHVLHLNHGLRGDESRGDADFVAAEAGGLGLPFTVTVIDLGLISGNLEQAGRQARQSFFADTRSRGVVDRVATGHTRSDQAETVLYRMLRGSGTAGLSGIRPVTSEGIVRPLIDCSRSEVEEFLTARGKTWREDRTNTDPAFARNRIRHHLLPLLQRDYSPEIVRILSATAGVAREEEEYWSDEIERIAGTLLEKKLSSVLVRADELLRTHPAIARRLLRRAFAVVKGDMRSIDLLHVERVMELAAQVEGHGRVQIPGLDIFRSFEWLRMSAPRTKTREAGGYSFRVELDGSACVAYRIPAEETSIRLERLPIPPADKAGAYNGDADELDWDRLPGTLELRNWRPGDELELRDRSRQKIKLLFQEFRIPIWDRHLWPVLTSGGEVVWARRFGPSALYLPDEGTRCFLRVSEVEGCREGPELE